MSTSKCCCKEEKKQTPDDDDNDNDKSPKSTVHQDDDDEQFTEDPKISDSEKQDPLPCPEQEEETIKKKYGGLTPKKPPLISKDHDHAYFDSADWALGKQGAQRSKGSLEALRPKLQPTPHHQVRSRRSAYAPADDDHDDDDDDGEDNDGGKDNFTPSEEEKKTNVFSDDNFHPDDSLRPLNDIHYN
ncbi:hypothetical protein ACH5RR_035885 [Cinchona calisaya]|uniref:Endosulphine n=1 Tax=Cinchona calisaya TaxID=153742 RepID=A0ABD2Y325_9GENT